MPCVSKKINVANFHESFSEALGALTQRFGDKHAEQDVLVNAHYEHFNGLCAKLDSTVSEETSRLSSRLEEVSGSLSSRVDQLVDSVRRQQQHFTDVCAKLDTKFSEKNAAQDQLFDDHRREVASVAAKLDAKFSADVSALDERVQAYHKHFTDLCTHLDKTAAEQLARVDSKFTQLCAAQELALRQKDELQDQQIEEQLLENLQLAKAEAFDATQALGETEHAAAEVSEQMAELDVSVHFGRKTMDVGALGVKEKPLPRTKKGHLAVYLK